MALTLLIEHLKKHLAHTKSVEGQGAVMTFLDW